MICSNCGTEVGISRFCTNCGVKMEEETVQWNSLQEFYKQYASTKTKMWVIWYLIMNFVGPVIDVFSLFSGNVVIVIDIVIRLGVGLIILRSKNWIAALCGVIYGAIFLLANIVLYQDVSLLIYVVVGCVVMKKLRKLKEEYEKYKVTGKTSEDV